MTTVRMVPADSPELVAIRELSAQITRLIGPEEGDDLDLDVEEVETTGQTLEVHFGNGEVIRISDVDQFHLELDETGEWPVGWVREDEETVHKAGYWDTQGEWHAFDTRYRNPRTQGMF